MEAKAIDTSTLSQWLKEGKPVQIVDIRPVHERTEWHIPGSIHMDAYAALRQHEPNALSQARLDPSVPVVTVCAGGKTSQLAADQLLQSGFEAYNLKDGMKGWSLAWNTATLRFDHFEIVQFRRTGKGCLSYMLVADGEAVVVDASLPVEVYIQWLEANGLTLKYAIDTHLHADHLSRTRELAAHYQLLPGLPACQPPCTFPLHAA